VLVRYYTHLAGTPSSTTTLEKEFDQNDPIGRQTANKWLGTSWPANILLSYPLQEVPRGILAGAGRRAASRNTVDQMERLRMRQRAWQLYGFGRDGVERVDGRTTLYSGNPTNFAVYTTLLLSLDVRTAIRRHTAFERRRTGKKVSATIVYFEGMPYTIVNGDTGLL
jgi:Serine hydroxymethyltransferase